MPRTNRRTGQLRCIANNRLGKLRNFPVVKQVIDALVFTYSVIVERLIYSCVRRLFSHNQISVPGKNEFYRLQKQVGNELTKMTHEYVQQARLRMTPGSLVSIDGSWDHRRNGSLCVVKMIDKKSKSIVDFEIASKPKQYVVGNTIDIGSRNLERIATERMVARWKNDQLVTHYVHDNDSSSRAVIEKSGWKAKEALDPGHACQAIERRLENFLKQNPRLLTGFKSKLLRWLQYLLRMDIT